MEWSPSAFRSLVVVKGMTARTIIDELLARRQIARGLVEATVRLPPRGHRWVAVYTGVEPGKQVWRSTGLTDRNAALVQAKKWEAEAKRQRAALGLKPRPAIIRVRRRGAVAWATDEPVVGPLSQRDVSLFLQISERAVRSIEKRALGKLRADPRLRELWREWMTRSTAEEPELAEGQNAALAASEIAALLGLARTAEERRTLEKLLAWLGSQQP